ncbi:hypothetical protein TNCV_4864581 [Trichonephila clavipes]|nr:hypothetical protein TNCV_4864581 [Trichonephila clavipes]
MSLEIDCSVSDINSRETNALAFIEDSSGQTLGFLMDINVLGDNTSSVENYISERPTVLKHTNTQEINNFSSEIFFLESPIVSNETILPDDKFVPLENNNNQVVSVSSENNAVKNAAISTESIICKTLVKEVDNVGNSAACIQSIGSVSQPERLKTFHTSSYENNMGNNSRGWLIVCPMGRQLFVFALGVRLEYDRPRHSIQFINDRLDYDCSLSRCERELPD